MHSRIAALLKVHHCNRRPGLEVHAADGIAFLSSRVNDIQDRIAAYIDFLFLDVFDGEDLLPDGFTQEGKPHSAVPTATFKCAQDKPLCFLSRIA